MMPDTLPKPPVTHAPRPGAIPGGISPGAAETVTEAAVRTPAWTPRPARASQRPRRRRGRRTLWAMLLAVGLPVSLGATWLFGFATDQYESEFRFAVRRHTPTQASSANASAMLGGGNPALAIIADSEMLVEYIRSRQAVDDAAATIDLQSIYDPPDVDWWSKLEPNKPVEDRVRHWRRFVDASLDLTSGLVSVDVRAFRPEDAQRVAAVVLADAERLVNKMSQRAQDDALRLAHEEAARTEARLIEVRQNLARFRNANSLLSPDLQASVQGNVLSHLREAVAEARASYAAQLANGIHPTVPSMVLLQSRIVSLEQELNGQRAELARPQTAAGEAAPLASVMNGYAGLEGQEHVAELAYERALANESEARLEAVSQSVYLNTFVQPALPESSTFPKRWLLLLQIGVGSFVVWCILTLIWQSLREHMD